VNWNQKRTALFTILIHSLLSVFLFIAGPFVGDRKNEQIHLLLLLAGYWCYFTHVSTTITNLNKMPILEI